MMRRGWVLSGIGLLVVAGALFLSGRMPGVGRKREPITLGAVLSLTGPGTFIGTEVRDGLQLAIDEINARGGINSRPLKLVIEDSRSVADGGVEAFKKLEQNSHPDLMVGVTGIVVSALVPLAEEYQVPFIGLVSGSPRETFKDKRWSFRLWQSSESVASSVLSLLERLDVKDLAILYLNDPYGNGVSQKVKPLVEAKGGTVVMVPFDPKATKPENFQEAVSQLAGTKAVFVIGWDPHLKAAFTALRTAQYPGLIFGPETATLPEVRKIPEAQGVYVPAPAIYNPNFIFAKELEHKYVARYQKPLTHYAAKGYDMLILLSGLLEDQPISRENIRSILDGGFVYSGCFGPLNAKPGDHDLPHELYPAQIENGEIKYL